MKGAFIDMSEAPQVKIPQIDVTMFGGFSLKIGDRTIGDETGRSKQLWTLLEYLIANRKNHISQEKLCGILWDEDDCSNPANALKNLVYRARNLIDSACEDVKGGALKYECIVFKRNVYSWNNELPCVIDIEEFESAFEAANKPGLTDNEKIYFYSKAVGLYKGDFLPKSSMQYWVTASSGYYENIYIKCVKNLCGLLVNTLRNDDAALVCEKALVVEAFDESLHELLINIYLLNGERRKAIDHYESASRLFYEKLGVKLSKSIRSTMQNVLNSMSEVEKDLSFINEDLNEFQKIEEAYYCDYEFFKIIYRAQARLAERSGQPVFVVLLTLEHGARAQQQKVGKAMSLLRDVVLCNLRKSDIVARYSNTQYILMLPSLTFENGRHVISRIVKKFDEQNKTRGMHISADI